MMNFYSPRPVPKWLSPARPTPAEETDAQKITRLERELMRRQPICASIPR